MSSGLMSNSVTSKRWRNKQEKAGKKRFVIWLSQEDTEIMLQLAEDEMLPNGVAVEKVVREYCEYERCRRRYMGVKDENSERIILF